MSFFVRFKLYTKNNLQHYIRNLLVASRYRMVHMGIPKDITLRYLMMVENFMKKINILT